MSPPWDPGWVVISVFLLSINLWGIPREISQATGRLCYLPLFPRCPTRAVDILRVHCLSLELKTLSISYSLRFVWESNPWPSQWQCDIVTNSTNEPKQKKKLHTSQIPLLLRCLGSCSSQVVNSRWKVLGLGIVSIKPHQKVFSFLSPQTDSNRQPSHYKCDALPL